MTSEMDKATQNGDMFANSLLCQNKPCLLINAVH